MHRRARMGGIDRCSTFTNSFSVMTLAESGAVHPSAHDVPYGGAWSWPSDGEIEQINSAAPMMGLIRSSVRFLIGLAGSVCATS